jgi:thymidylate synthase (FAD)
MENTKINPLAEVKLLNAGLCALMSVDGNDLTPAQAARTSYRDFVDAHTQGENENLVDYLIRKRHDTPVEFAGATFYMVMPIFVARQLVRHRTASINEESLRYVNAREEFYIPSREECKAQSTVNKQGSGDLLDDDTSKYVINYITNAGEESHQYYDLLLTMGLSKELARTVLPLGQYTAWYWKANLRNIFHMLHLRDDAHAQYQIQVYARAMSDMLKPYFPNTFAAWENHVHGAVTFSADEWEILKKVLLWKEDGHDTSAMDLVKIEANLGEHGMRPTRIKEFIAKCQK